MFTRSKCTALLASLALAIVPAVAQAQIFEDTEFLETDYDSNTNVPLNSTIDFNVDYSNIDRFSGFLNVSLPEAPRTPVGATATTGVFLTANDDSLNVPNVGNETFSAIMPKTTNVNVGSGTANPNYKVTIDVYHSSAAGFDDDGTGTSFTQTGSTNYSVIGLNQTNTTVQLQELNTGGAGAGGLTGQGLALGVTADGGAGDDYFPLYGGARYIDRDLGEEPGQSYTQASNNATAAVNTGLLGRHLNDYWEAQGLGFEFDDSDSDDSNNLNRTTGNATHFAPDPNDLSNYPTTFVRPAADAFPIHSDPLHYSCGGSNCGLTGAQTLAGNSALSVGVPYNAWATHELYWVDGEFTYVIDDVPVLQIEPDNDGQGGDDNIFNDYSDSGSVLLAFWDRFGGSISINPEGANFVVFDNLTVEAATSGDAPTVLDYLGANGFLISSGGDTGPGDFAGDGIVEGADLTLLLDFWNKPAGAAWVTDRPTPEGSNVAGDELTALLDNWNNNYLSGNFAAATIPEPSTLAIALLASIVGLATRRVG